MARVFISYSNHDDAEALEIKEWLDVQGFAPAFLAIDKHTGISPGAEWERTVYNEIKRCQALLILQTLNWSASRWCYAEFILARSLDKKIFEVVQSDEAAAEEPIAKDLQRLDLSHNREAGLAQLKRELIEIALQDQGGFAWPPNRPPFPGLVCFEEEDAAVFFGREDDCRAVIDRLKVRRVQGGPRLLVLQGASGSGKSSLLRAGVLPRLKRAAKQWLVLPPINPGSHPRVAFAMALAQSMKGGSSPSMYPKDWRFFHQELLRAQSSAKAAPQDLHSLLRNWINDLRDIHQMIDAQVLLPIDQAEELFTVAEEEERKGFLALLGAALAERTGLHPLPLQVLMTIRVVAVGKLQAEADLHNRFEILPLSPLFRERWREIIEEPARKAGLEVEPALVQFAIMDVVSEDALPLLAFALGRLYEQYGTTKKLTLENYKSLAKTSESDKLSPLERVVSDAANDAIEIASIDNDKKAALRKAFLAHLVKSNELGLYFSCPAPRKNFSKVEDLINALVAKKLLVERTDEKNEPIVEVAHEALLRVWPLLKEWLEDSQDALRLREQLMTNDLKDYKNAKREVHSYLLAGTKLKKAASLLNENGDLLDGQEYQDLKEFIKKSSRKAWRRKCREVIIWIIIALALLVLSVYGFLQSQNKQAAEAGKLEATHRELMYTNPSLSAIYGLAAAESFLNHPASWESIKLSDTISQDIPDYKPLGSSINTSQEQVLSLIALGNGELISGGKNGIIKYWRWIDSQLQAGHESIANQGEILSLTKLSIADDQEEVISGGSDGTLRRWVDGKPVGDGLPIDTSQQRVLSLITLSNGDVISGGFDGTLKRWRRLENQLLAIGPPIDTKQGSVTSLIALEDRKEIELISGGSDGTLMRWRVTDEGLDSMNQKIPTRHGKVTNLLLLKNGDLVSAGMNGTLQRWQMKGVGQKDGLSLVKDSEIYTGQSDINSLVELESGKMISGGMNGTMRSWIDGEPFGNSKPFPTEQKGVLSLIAVKNGNVEELISGGEDGTLRRWQAKYDQLENTNDQSISSLIVLRNRKGISAESSGILRLWHWKDGKLENEGTSMPAVQRKIVSLLELKNGDLISGGSDGTLMLWRWRDADGKLVNNGESVPTGQRDIVNLLALDDGNFVSGGSDGTLMLWHMEDGRLANKGMPIPTDQKSIFCLIQLRNGDLISAGSDGSHGTLRHFHWKDQNLTVDGDPIPARQGMILSLLERKNGDLISGGNDGSLQIWQLRDNSWSADEKPLYTGQGEVRFLIGLPNGDVVIGGKDGTLRGLYNGNKDLDIWQIATGEGQALYLTLSTDGELISAGSHGLLRSFSLSAVAKEACDQFSVEISHAEYNINDVKAAAKRACNQARGSSQEPLYVKKYLQLLNTLGIA